jgi:hypothetical protein
VPKGGFFFAGSLAPDQVEDEYNVAATSDLEAAIAENMVEVAEVENVKQEEARASAAKYELVKNGILHYTSLLEDCIADASATDLAQVILREQPNVQLVRADKPKKKGDIRPGVYNKPADKEEFLRTEYYKNCHKGAYHSKCFDNAAKK